MIRPATTAVPWFPTPATWAAAMVPHVDALLVDQAHLEKKAAAAAIGLLFRVPAGSRRQQQLAALAREELVHFERTLRLLAARGTTFAPQQPAGYAGELKRQVAADLPQRLVDELLVAAIIEARSCERMQLLAAALRPGEPAVAAFYAELCAAEQRHEQLYTLLAAELAGAGAAAARHCELVTAEGEILRRLPPAPRLHGGIGQVAAVG